MPFKGVNDGVKRKNSERKGLFLQRKIVRGLKYQTWKSFVTILFSVDKVETGKVNKA